VRVRRFIVWLAALAALVALTSCAYFNTLYNAKKKYNDAQKSERAANQPAVRQTVDEEGNVLMDTRRLEPTTSTSANTEIYQQVIEKCKHVIARYPDSRHVDDAMLLIGKSLFALNRFDESASALDSLTSRYPKTNLREEADFLRSKALVKGEHYDAAVTALNEFVDNYRGSDDRPEAFYLLCTSLMQLGLADNAVAALQRLEKDHGRSEYRYKAQTDMATILVDKGLYKESLAVYERLSRSRIPKNMRYDVYMGMSRAQIELGQYQEALKTLENTRRTQLTLEQEPRVLLLRGRGYAGADSTARALQTYKSVADRYARGTYGAEADYRLGILYESMDSLKTAQRYYQEVPRAFSGSDYAEDAIKRAGDISRVLRLQESEGDNSPEADALRTFSMAEIQLLQFNNTEKAIPSYEKIVNEFPQSEFAPKSAYALGYIYGVVLRDSVKAKEWYDILRTRYGDSQQAQLAYAFYKGATPPPSIDELMRYGVPKTPPVPVASPDTTMMRTMPPDTTRATPPDTTHAPARVLPDSLREPLPDTTSSPPDTSDGN
jgi:TolA-binding protein